MKTDNERQYTKLSRRERQIMDILYRREQATAADVQRELPDPPGYSAVRSALRLLEQKGLVRHERDGQRYLYQPTAPKQRIAGSALRHVLATFFDGSRQQAVSSLLADEEFRVSDEDYERLSRLLEAARRRGRES